MFVDVDHRFEISWIARKKTFKHFVGFSVIPHQIEYFRLDLHRAQIGTVLTQTMLSMNQPIFHIGDSLAPVIGPQFEEIVR